MRKRRLDVVINLENKQSMIDKSSIRQPLCSASHKTFIVSALKRVDLVVPTPIYLRGKKKNKKQNIRRESNGKEREIYTLSRLCFKTSLSNFDALPILLIMWLVKSNTSRSLSPSKTAPKKPRAIKHISIPSACMKMDRIDPLTRFMP